MQAGRRSPTVQRVRSFRQLSDSVSSKCGGGTGLCLLLEAQDPDLPPVFCLF